MTCRAFTLVSGRSSAGSYFDGQQISPRDHVRTGSSHLHFGGAFDGECTDATPAPSPASADLLSPAPEPRQVRSSGTVADMPLLAPVRQDRIDRCPRSSPCH